MLTGNYHCTVFINSIYIQVDGSGTLSGLTLDLGLLKMI